MRIPGKSRRVLSVKSHNKIGRDEITDFFSRKNHVSRIFIELSHIDHIQISQTKPAIRDCRGILTISLNNPERCFAKPMGNLKLLLFSLKYYIFFRFGLVKQPNFCHVFYLVERRCRSSFCKILLQVMLILN